MIKQHKNIYFIGTSHIAQQSIDEVKQTIFEKKPSVVALELDKKRLAALFAKKRRPSFRDIGRFGVRGFLFNIIGASIEKKLGKLVGTSPGSELKEALRCAQQINAKIALIDQDVTITLRKLSAQLTWKEKARFGKELLRAFIGKKPTMTFDLRKVPNDKVIQKITSEVKRKYPSVYKTLIEERDKYMAKALNKIQNDYPAENIVAVIGAGHINGVIKRIKNEGHILQKRGNHVSYCFISHRTNNCL